MRRAKRGLDTRNACYVPDDERATSPLEVKSLGSILYSHQVRFVRSGHFLAESDIIKFQSAVLNALAKSSSRIASPFVTACFARAGIAWIQISYPPLSTSSLVADILSAISAQTFLQYAFDSSLRKGHQMLTGLTSTFRLSLYNAINLDFAASSPGSRGKSPLPHRVAKRAPAVAQSSLDIARSALFKCHGVIC